MVQQLLFGIEVGSYYAISAIGFTLVYRYVGMLNFAHAEYMTIGAYVAAFLSGTLGLSIVLNIPLVMGISAVTGLALARVFFSPIHHKGAIPLLLTSVGVGFMLRNGIRMVFGPTEQHLAPVPGTYRFEVLGGVFISNQMLLIVGLALGVFAVTYLLLTRTTLGMAMRATGDSERLARATGVDTGRIRIYVWLLSSAMAGLSGYVLALQQSASPSLGLDAILIVITAAILGGAGNPYGAIAGAYIIGVAMTLATGLFLPGLLSGLGTAVAFVILILILLVRPGGITGEEVAT